MLLRCRSALMSSSSGGTEPRLARRLSPMATIMTTTTQAGRPERGWVGAGEASRVGAGMGGWVTERARGRSVSASTTAERNSSIRLPIPNMTTPTRRAV